jgi:autotransporter-associated beta strand protein
MWCRGYWYWIIPNIKNNVQFDRAKAPICRQLSRWPNCTLFLIFGISSIWTLSLSAGTWTGAAGDNLWSTAGNWTGGEPNAIDASAVFPTVGSTSFTISLTASRTVGSLSFDSTNAYVINPAAAQTITLDVTSGSATLTSTTGTHTISAGLVLNEPFTITQNSSGTLTLSGAIAESGSRSLTKAGTGVLVLSDTSNSYSGGTILSDGTLSVSNNGQFGASSSGITLQGGTLLFSSGFEIPSARAITLSGGTTTDTQGNNVTVSGVISGAGSLTKISAGTLTLSGNNTFAGGVTVNGSTLSISSDSNLGATSGGVTLGGATLSISQTLSSARSLHLTAAAIIATDANTLVVNGVVQGTGSLEKTGSGTLTLNGSNSFSGGLTVTAGTVRGSTSAFSSAIANSGAVVFDQDSDGSYTSSLSGTGTVTKVGSGAVTLTGNSNNLTGSTTVSAGSWIVDGTIGLSAVTVTTGALLGGNGTVGPLTINGGTLSPGSSIGTLTVLGNLSLDANATSYIEIAPLSSDQVIVTGTAALNGALQIVPLPGFYPLTQIYTIIEANGGVSADFATFSVNSSNFSIIKTVGANSVTLTSNVIAPFFEFPFVNFNTQQVGATFNDMGRSGVLSQNADFVRIINDLAGKSFSVINDALDQMHPAMMSALLEQSAFLSSQLLSLYRQPNDLDALCHTDWDIWAKPFLLWHRSRPEQEQIGFRSDTAGLAVGADYVWNRQGHVGVGCVWSRSDINWTNQRGDLEEDAVYGALYASFRWDRFRLGLASIIGVDWLSFNRALRFSVLDRQAEGSTHALDAFGRLDMAYVWGSSQFQLFPYLIFDGLYRRVNGYQENGASALNLDVDTMTSIGGRSELGLGIKVTDTNWDETISLSPIASLGWIVDWPIRRPLIQARFVGYPHTMNIRGWNRLRQLLGVTLGFEIKA